MSRAFMRWVVLLAVAFAFAACDKKEETQKQAGEETKAEKKEAKKEEAAETGEVAAAEKKEAEEAATEKAGEAEEPAKDDPAHKLLQAAIEGRGGLEKCKAVGAMSGKTKGTYMGKPYTAEFQYKIGEAMHMDISMPGGQGMSMTFGSDECWNKIGPVVVPCKEDQKKENVQMLAFDKAVMLWPLAEGDWQIEAGKKKEGDKEYDTLSVKSEKLGVEGTLVFDPESHMLVNGTAKGSWMGKEGEYSFKMSDYSEECGVQMAHKSETAFNGEKFMDEEYLEINCEPIDEQVFAMPEQVKDGTIVERDIPARTLACTTMKGPYEGTGKAIEGLMAFMGKKKMEPMGAPVLTYLKAPPKVKKPKKFVTDICFPVGAPPPRRPKKSGKFVIKAAKPQHVLSVYGVGSYDKKVPELMKTLVKEAKKRKLKVKGRMGHACYSEPGAVPPEEMVSEMMLPIKAKKVKGKRDRKGKRRKKGKRGKK